MTENSETPNTTTPADATKAEVPEATPTPDKTEGGASLTGGEAAAEEGETPAAEPETESSEPEFTPLSADDLVFPDGVEVNETKRDEFLSVLNDAKKGELDTAAMANRLLELQHQSMQEAATAASTAWQEQQSAWESEVTTAYGKNLEQTQAAIGRVIDQFGGDDANAVREILATTGAGNHPGLFNLFARIADQFSEGTPVQAAPASSNESRASRLFPSMKG